MLKKLILFTIAMSLVSCAFPTKEDCKKMDYYQVGFDFGAEGKAEQHGLQHYGQKCTQTHGVSVDRERYSKGYEDGLKLFCKPNRAYLAGKSGEHYSFPHVCPEDTKKSHRVAYKSGLKDYCTFVGGVEAGLSGKTYNGICGENDERFLKGYNQGFQKRTLEEIASLRRKVDDLEDELASKNHTIFQLESKISDLEAQKNSNY